MTLLLVKYIFRYVFLAPAFIFLMTFHSLYFKMLISVLSEVFFKNFFRRQQMTTWYNRRHQKSNQLFLRSQGLIRPKKTTNRDKSNKEIELWGIHKTDNRSEKWDTRMRPCMRALIIQYTAEKNKTITEINTNYIYT